MNKIERNIADGVGFVSVAAPKFKTNIIEIVFLLPSGQENNASVSMLQQLLTEGSKKYPTLADISRRRSMLYGASLTSDVSIRGDMIQLSVGVGGIDNRYALAQEDLLSEMLELLTECVFRPNADNGAFNEPLFSIAKQDQLDAIDALINDKRAYASKRVQEIAFAGEPCAYPSDGTREDTEALTPEYVYAAYERFLQEAIIRIYHVGPDHAPQIADKMQEIFAGIERNPVPMQIDIPSPCKSEPVREDEPMEVMQSKLAIVLKGKVEKKGAMNLMNDMLGGTPFSLLFNNVREKLSLCYYCSSRFSPYKKAIVISSGVELQNAERTYEAVMEQLDAIRKGEFEDEVLENARRSILDSICSQGDSVFSYMAQCHANFCNQEEVTTEELIERYENLTRQDVIDAANALRLDTVYLMQQEVQA